MKRLKELRIQNHMTQQEVAKELNVSQATYWGYEKGTYQPSNDMLIALSKLFHTSIDDILENNSNGKMINLSILSKQKQTLILEILNADEYELDELVDNYFQRQLAELQEKMKNAIALPTGYEIGQTVFMVPTEINCLKNIASYRILDLTLSEIGIRVGLSILKKQKGIDTMFCANLEMFGKSIFATEDEARKYLEGRK